jgi:hypothetical protein
MVEVQRHNYKGAHATSNHIHDTSMKRLLWISLALMAKMATAQTTVFLSGGSSGGGASDTNLDYVRNAGASTGSMATTLDVTLDMGSGESNKCVALAISTGNYTTTSISGVTCTTTSATGTQAASSQVNVAYAQSAIYYVKDSGLPSSGNAVFRVTVATAADIHVVAILYNGVNQTTPFTNVATSAGNCGGTTSSITINGNTFSYSWTNTACTEQCGAVINGASTGSQRIDALMIESSETGISATGSNTVRTSRTTLNYYLVTSYQ